MTEEVIMYSSDQTVTLALNGIIDFDDKKLLAYWAFLITTEEGNKYNSGDGNYFMTFVDFKKKYPKSKWDIKNRKFLMEDEEIDRN